MAWHVICWAFGSLIVIALLAWAATSINLVLDEFAKVRTDEDTYWRPLRDWPWCWRARVQREKMAAQRQGLTGRELRRQVIYQVYLAPLIVPPILLLLAIVGWLTRHAQEA